MLRLTRLVSLFAIILVVLTACNFPSKQANGPATEDPNVVFTAAAQTVEANLTQAAILNPPTVPSLATATLAASTATQSVPPTNTVPAASATQECDKSAFVSDVTIPDGTVLAPGESFTKTWRLKNVGTCSWTPSYAVVFQSGDSMSGPATQALAGNVNPGETVDISIALKAPSTEGDYTSYWKLRNASGVLFAQFYVQIKVATTSSGFDLHSQAINADWKSGAGNLTFGGPDTDTNGFAMYKNGGTLEDGSTPPKVLETHPEWVDNGVISGLYPAYKVVNGEHFIAKIGFMGPCGVGDAIFQLNYRESGTLHSLGSWSDTCDGSLQNVNLDLSSIAGHTVQFVLAVQANGTSAQDWAVWVSPRVEIP